jgi:hypothetical protein
LEARFARPAGSAFDGGLTHVNLLRPALGSMNQPTRRAITGNSGAADMTIPIDPDTRVSPELSEVMNVLLNNPDVPDPATLGTVREILRHSLADADREEDTLVGGEETLLAELEALIDEFGDDALASDFVTVSASEALSELIEAILERSDEDEEVVLGDVRAAIDTGLLAALEGEGLIESEEAQAIVAEIDALIERYGTDLPAEDVLRMD